MRVACCRSLPILVLFGALTAAQTASVATARAAEPAAKAPVVVTYPQIVRLNYVQGDVRVSRGKEGEKQIEQEPGVTTGWEQAAANLPLATGYSLVTGTGRAEIEFEDASVVYLGENSVLTFNELSTRSGVPYTELALLSGTATMNVQTLLPGECFRIFTPGDSFSVLYPKKAYLRINSYLDAIAVTPQQDVPWFAPLDNAAGKTVTVHNGRPVPTPEIDANAMAEWDKWVAGRVSTRDGALAAAMKEAGLTEPIPGLAEMSGQGKFFACEPYGMCWEPTEGWAGHTAEESQVAQQPEGVSGTGSGGQVATGKQPAAASSTQAPGVAGWYGKPNVQAYQAAHPGEVLSTEDYAFPCSEFAIQRLIALDPVTGKEKIVASEWAPFTQLAGWSTGGYPMAGYRRIGWNPQLWGYPFLDDDPWDWAVCHAGSWIRWQHHYVWVVGTKRHHRRPVRWVKRGREVGYVPIHPKDVASKIPINMRDGVFKATKKGGTVIVQRVNFKEGKPVELMNEVPKEFRKPILQPLEHAEIPHLEAHTAFNAGQQFRGAAPGGFVIAKGTVKTGSTTDKGTAMAGLPIAKGTVKTGSAMETGLAMKQPGTPITFDRKTQSFMVARPVIENGRPSTVVVPLGGGGNGYPAARGTVSYGSAQSGTTYSNGGGGARSNTPAPSYNSGSGSTSRSSTPAPSYSAPAPSYSPPAQSYSPPAQSYSPPPAPTYSAPPPSNNGGGASGGSGGASHR